VLSRLSLDHGVDWEISHDASDGPIGYIRNGICDDEVLNQVGALADLGDIFSELDEEGLA
jgi:hypothetical protein